MCSGKFLEREMVTIPISPYRENEHFKIISDTTTILIFPISLEHSTTHNP